MAPFDEHYLKDIGFTGFAPVVKLPRGVRAIPSRPGVYAVMLDSSMPSFLRQSVGGHFKRRDPTVSPAILAGKWINRTPTVYIGRSSDLRERIEQLARFGRGEPVRHWGGRYLWQLAEHRDLKVCWRQESDPVSAEAELLEAFERIFGQLPFANIVRGRTRPRLAA